MTDPARTPPAALPPHVQPVPLAQASRLLNHGPTVLISAAHGGRRNLMAAAWAMPLDFEPPKVAVVIDKSTYTRRLVEASGRCVLQVPSGAQADLTTTVGNTSGQALADAGSDKFSRHGIAHFSVEGAPAPLVAGCLAWLACHVIPWPAVSAAHDLFLAEVLAAWADERAFAQGRWRFDADTPAERRSLHHLGAGHYVLAGEALTGRVLPPEG